MKRALARMRAYTPPPFNTWDKLPLSRRAAVLLLLFSDRRGDLRVVITMRASSLRNYSGIDPYMQKELIPDINPRSSRITRRQSRQPDRDPLPNQPP